MKVFSQKPAFGNFPGKGVHVDRKHVVFDRGMVLPGAGQGPVTAAYYPALVINTGFGARIVCYSDSDLWCSHIAFSQTRRGSFVECSGVCVVTVNWNRQSPLEH